MEYFVKFPDPNQSDDEGLVAMGGELSPEFLLSAYRQGVFPWFNENNPILWWSPNPRLVLFPDKFKVSDSFKQTIRSKRFTFKIDSNFKEVIAACAKVKRNGQDGTWITSEMRNAYIDLHKLGYAHSFETYTENTLVGGLYGVSLGRAFFGESMFHYETDASKFALHILVEFCKEHRFDFIDAQQPTRHLKSLGAEEIGRKKFLGMLKSAVDKEFRIGIWEFC